MCCCCFLFNCSCFCLLSFLFVSVFVLLLLLFSQYCIIFLSHTHQLLDFVRTSRIILVGEISTAHNRDEKSNKRE